MFVRLFLSFVFFCILASFLIYSENGRDLKGKLFRWAEYGNENLEKCLNKGDENLTKDEVFELYKSGAYKTERSEDNAYDYENALSYIRYKNKQPCRQ
ncbi:MAG TPA: hypothetical protein PK453_11675 [Leptospiraceae bacterium]|nr:hypothetical protein [Leptospiraceae bacterium]HNF14321.1 hypothetical protein [Leptospiraceae bacterium]HNI94625.1 hypothetical protein [Leptospiraceae bacterium]HNN05256.1 hypothetical protein [Leptospiraceae bacterium]